ncbi:hypothetical protein MMC07_003409 [Pseudocyphellaria aurata]|nr:hypothetical protein [Pseudocyphellaria aurata]
METFPQVWRIPITATDLIEGSRVLCVAGDADPLLPFVVGTLHRSPGCKPDAPAKNNASTIHNPVRLKLKPSKSKEELTP